MLPVGLKDIFDKAFGQEVGILKVGVHPENFDFRKGLVKDVFEANRKRVIGW